jgi:SAM-dependent methyltransferase
VAAPLNSAMEPTYTNSGNGVACPACGHRRYLVPCRIRFGASGLMRCPSCRTEFLEPPPNPTRLAEIYGRAYYEPWDWEDEAVVKKMKARTFRRALRYASFRPGARLLDVGCARGEFAETATAMGLDVTGIDVNSDAIARARQRVPEAVFHCAQLAPGTPPGVWDLVTMFDFIEHVDDPVETLRVAATALAPSGQILISTPRAGSLGHRLAGRWWPEYREEHLVLFSRKGLGISLARAGLGITAIVSTVKYASTAYLLGQAVEYGPQSMQPIARRARALLTLPVTHAPLPLRFGEMTVVSSRL